MARSRSSPSVDETLKQRKKVDEQLRNLREMIHPNEWNNIPACVRSAIMGLIDFNDTTTQRLTHEDFSLLQKINQSNDN